MWPYIFNQKKHTIDYNGVKIAFDDYFFSRGKAAGTYNEHEKSFF